MNKNHYYGYSFNLKHIKKRNKNKYVYVLSEGESCEGHSPKEVYETLKKAKNSRKNIKFRKLNNNTWIKDGEDVWEVYIEKFRVL